MKIEPFSKKCKYLYHDAPMGDGGYVRTWARLPFKRQYGYGKEEGSVDCILVKAPYVYHDQEKLFNRIDLWENEPVRQLFYQLVELLPDLEAIRKLQDIETMERLL